VDDQGSAEEAVQDAFVAVARRGAQGLEDPAAYLRTAVLNNARSTLRKRRVRRRHLRNVERPATAPGADHDVLVDDDARQVLAALDELSERQREVLVLRYWADLSEAEIATTLGISAGSVKTHAHRGTAALARILEAP
jgi:RNA polymerase sigma factor (sigma-70 family)